MAGNFLLNVHVSVYLLLSWVRPQAEASLPLQGRSQPLGGSHSESVRTVLSCKYLNPGCRGCNK